MYTTQAVSVTDCLAVQIDSTNTKFSNLKMSPRKLNNEDLAQDSLCMTQSSFFPKQPPSPTRHQFLSTPTNHYINLKGLEPSHQASENSPHKKRTGTNILQKLMSNEEKLGENELSKFTRMTNIMHNVTNQEITKITQPLFSDDNDSDHEEKPEVRKMINEAEKEVKKAVYKLEKITLGDENIMNLT